MVLQTSNRVLILILLEYGLRHAKKEDIDADKPCLNPYSIGIWSATQHRGTQRTWLLLVLILILLEYGLRQQRDTLSMLLKRMS